MDADKPDTGGALTSLEVAKAYLQAVHARDFDAAYEFIASSDRKFLDKRRYLLGHPPFNGFALQLGRWFAAEMKFRVIDDRSDYHRARLQIAYVVPSGDEIADRIFGWNADRLNELGQKDRSQIIQHLENLKKHGKMITSEGRESIELGREEQSWKVYENWSSRQRVMFRATAAAGPSLGVRFLRNDILVKTDEPFQVDFTVTNRSQRGLWVRLQHSFLPRVFEQKIDMIACGSLAPFRLEPGEIRSIMSVYLFRGAMPDKRPLTINYEFTSGDDARMIKSPVTRGGLNG